MVHFHVRVEFKREAIYKTARLILADAICFFVTLLKCIIMTTHEFIEINPKIMMGKPIIKGARITVEQILESLSESNSIDEVLQAHPHLTKDHVHAALSFAAKSIRGDEIILYRNNF